MTQPRTYTRQYNFNDFQTTSPSTPLPASQVDAELNAAKLTLDDLNTSIGLIQRDDGKLRNLSVHKDSFDVDALALLNSGSFTPKGSWSSGVVYALNELVDFNDATYVVTSAHTSSSAFATDLAASRWLLLANGAINSSSHAVDKFEGTGSQTAFTLSYTYGGALSVQVFVNGSLRNPTDDYSISGTTLTFVTAPSVPSVSGNENVIVWGPSVITQAAITSAQTSASNASGFADESQEWSSKVSGIVESTDYSSKAYAIGGVGITDTASKGAAKEWATKTSGTVDGTNFSAKYWATQANVGIVAGVASDVTAVAGVASDVTTVASVVGSSGITLGQDKNLIFEGSVADSFETTLSVINPTADRTVSLPDSAGTLALDADKVNLSNNNGPIVLEWGGALSSGQLDGITMKSNRPYLYFYEQNYTASTVDYWYGIEQNGGEFKIGWYYDVTSISGNPTIGKGLSPERIAIQSNTQCNQVDFLSSGGNLSKFKASISSNGLILGEDIVLRFKGATDNFNETQIYVVDPTADRQINFPDASGTVALTSDISAAGNTNISSTTASSTITVVSSSGTDAVVASATTSAAGVMSASDKVKLDGLSSGFSSLSDDLSPELGGNLVVNGNTVDGVAIAARDAVLTSTTTTANAALPKAGGAISGAISTAQNANLSFNPNGGTGAGQVVFMGDGTSNGVAGRFKLNCSANSHGITIQGPAHSAGANYTLTLPTDDGTANQVLKSDGAGVLSWADNPTFTGGTVANSTTFSSGVEFGAEIKEKYNALTGTSVELSPSLGTVQTHVLNGNSTYSASSFGNEHSMTLNIFNQGSHTVTWPTITWMGNGGVAPTIATGNKYSAIVLWKVVNTLFGAFVGTEA